MPRTCVQCGAGDCHFEGWIFDLVEQQYGIDVWVFLPDGRMVCVWDDWQPSLFLFPKAGEARKVERWLEMFPGVRSSWTQRTDVYTHKRRLVLQVTSSHARYRQLPRDVRRRWSGTQIYNGGLAPASYYCYETGVFPLARVNISACNHGRLTDVEVLDQMRDTDYVIPPFSTLKIRMEGEPFHPKMQERGALVVSMGDESLTLEPTDPRELLETLRDMIVQYDPDIIFTAWGDDELMPTLESWSQRVGVDIPWHRRKVSWKRDRERSYWTYGKVIHRPGAWYMQGRWHIDKRNSFLCSEGGLPGILEVARISQVPVQRMARSTIGTAMNSMELSCAVADGVLIPMDKQVAESIKSARALVTSDKGGLVFQPVVGVHEEVIELDFASMYPTIMVEFNISPETVGCDCCENNVVPELGYNVCQKHRGIVPSALETILYKRTVYKEISKDETADPAVRARAEQCQCALKWILVTCFGYLGYKNARFGKIEAHEAVTAYGREMLLRAKDLAEARGFSFLHGIVDAIWVQKPGVTDAEIEELQDEIATATSIPIKLEGIYRWVAFLGSTRDRRMPVANKYFGIFQDGTPKVRGIEWRRHDAPQFIKNAQHVLMEALSRTRTCEEARAVLMGEIPELAQFFDDVAAGRVPFRELAINTRLSRDPQLYKVESYGAIAAKELLGRGVNVSAGRMVSYIIADAKSKDPTSRVRAFPFVDADWSPDLEKYADLLQRGLESIAHPFELDIEISQPQTSGEYAISAKSTQKQLDMGAFL